MRRRDAALLALAIAPLPGCTAQKITQAATEAAQTAGMITEDEQVRIDQATEVARRGFEDLTPQEEHSIGRAVAATILSRYPLLEDARLEAYVNRVGRAVSDASSRPETWGGWHFAVLDSPEANAFAAPGGFVFVTRGMLDLVRDEDGLAAVLAHEVAHVAAKHGVASIEKQRLTDAFSLLAREAGAELGSAELGQLVDLFDGAVGDVVRTLLEKGYSRGQEEVADRLAVTILQIVGYAPEALVEVLDSKSEAAGGLGVLRTHPSSAERQQALAREIAGAGPGSDRAPRVARFEGTLGPRARS
jgi:predicted Zn-dependent protease